MLKKRTSTNGNVGQAEAIYRLHQLHRHVQKRQMLESIFTEIKEENLASVHCVSECFDRHIWWTKIYMQNLPM